MLRRFALLILYLLPLVLINALGIQDSQAMSPYIPALEATVTDDEPCFYAKIERDVHRSKDSAEFPKIRQAELTIDNMKISKGKIADVSLQGTAENCIKISQLFPKKITRLIETGMIYYIQLGVVYDSELQAHRQEVELSYKSAEGKLPVLPLFPTFQMFEGSFCLVQNDEKRIQMAPSNSDKCRHFEIN